MGPRWLKIGVDLVFICDVGIEASKGDGTGKQRDRMSVSERMEA